MLRAARAVATVIALATVPVACSGGDPSLSVAEFRRQAVDACRGASRATATTSTTTGGANGADAVAVEVERLRRRIATEQRTLTRLRALDPPDSRRALVDDWLRAAAGAIAAEQRAVDAVEGGDLAAADVATVEAHERNRRADAAATRLGVAACVSPAS
jgi:hypothetical protein